jgi:hypothetical protein
MLTSAVVYSNSFLRDILQIKNVQKIVVLSQEFIIILHRGTHFPVCRLQIEHTLIFTHFGQKMHFGNFLLPYFHIRNIFLLIFGAALRITFTLQIAIAGGSWQPFPFPVRAKECGQTLEVII